MNPTPLPTLGSHIAAEPHGLSAARESLSPDQRRESSKTCRSVSVRPLRPSLLAVSAARKQAAGVVQSRPKRPSQQSAHRAQLLPAAGDSGATALCIPLVGSVTAFLCAAGSRSCVQASCTCGCLEHPHLLLTRDACRGAAGVANVF